MQTIITKVLPATNTKPTRVKAQTSNGSHTITVSTNNYANYDEAHTDAVRRLSKRTGWPGPLHMTSGSLNKRGDLCWVFRDTEDSVFRLRSKGHAVAVLAPHELRGVDPKDIEQTMVSAGNKHIEEDDEDPGY